MISVIIVVKNNCKSIQETLQSVAQQTLCNIECIVVDGASTDGTLEVLQRNADSIDVLISEPDCGVYEAMNKGIRFAGGEWIIFLGADDRFVDRTVLARIFSRSYNSLLLYGNVLWGSSGLSYDGHFSKSKLMWKNICHQSIFYHRELFRRIGVFSLKYRLWADWDFNIRAFADAETQACYIHEVVAVYGNTGMTQRHCDDAFLSDRLRKVSELFGPWYALLYRLLFRLVHRGILYRNRLQ